LFVFDNFETMSDPIDLYQFIDTHIRLPNKVLITTRMREFKADYPIEVRGMTRDQFEDLVSNTAQQLNIEGLLTPTYRDSLFDEADGHPYITKLLLGQVAREGKATKPERLLGQADDALKYLFERTYGSLSPAVQRVFLTLCNWKSMVPVPALEAALLRPRNERMDVVGAIDALRQASLIEVITADDGVEFARVPLSASLFGQAKLQVSAMRPAVEVDTLLLQRLGPTQVQDLGRGIAPRAERLLREAAAMRAQGEDVSDDLAVLEHLSTAYPRIWLSIADMYLEEPNPDVAAASEAVERFLTRVPEDKEGWRRVAQISRRMSDGDAEVNARVRLAEMANADFEDIADAASALAFNRGSLQVGSDAVRAMELKLIALMTPRIDEATATELSRLAWLHVHNHQFEDARAVVRRGLVIDSGNSHLLGLAKRLDLPTDPTGDSIPG
jgi:hypothetical protein